MYLGIDIGTSGVKSVLIDAGQSLIASATSPLDIIRAQSGYSEQHPEWWWDAVQKTIATLQKNHQHELSAVQAIGLSGQMHGLVALDQDDAPLRPASLWNDTRCAAEAQVLDTQYPAFRTIGGNAVMPGFTAPKALWMRSHEPELFNQIKTILLPKDYIRFRMTGEKISDLSDASGTLWLDIENRDWSDELLAACGLTTAQMPALVEGSDASAVLSKDIAQQWGMANDVVIAGGAGDNAASAIGLGVIAPGHGLISLGTSGVVFSVTDQFAPAADSGAHAFCHSLPATWHQMGVILSASDSISWLMESTGLSVDELTQKMDATNSLETSPIFHPYLSGERTPHNNADACGAFFDIKRHHHQGDLMRAVLQGVSFGIADAYDVLVAAGGKPSSILATGGGSQNITWINYIASIIDTPISIPKHQDIGAAMGAARLAMMASGLPIEQVCTAPEIAETITPDPDITAALTPARQKSQNLYNAIAALAY